MHEQSTTKGSGRSLRLTPWGATQIDQRLAELCAQQIPWPDVVETLNREFGLRFTEASYRQRTQALGIARTTCDRGESARRAVAARDALHDAQHPRWNSQPPETVIANPLYEEECGIISEFVICRICGKQLNSMNSHLAANPPANTFTHPGVDLKEYQRRFPEAPIYSLAVKQRNLDHALADYKVRRPEIRARANARYARVAALAKRTPEEMTKAARLTVAAGLELKKTEKYQISFSLFPEQNVRKVAVDNTKKFFRRNPDDIGTERIRLCSLSDDIREAAIRAAISYLARQATPKQT